VLGNPWEAYPYSITYIFS